MSSSGLVQVDSRHQRGQGLLDWALVRDRTERTWIDPLPDAELDWLLAATQTRNTSLSAQGAAIAAPLGIVAAAFAAALKHGVPSWLSVPTLLCLALAHELADIADSLSLPRFRAADLRVDTKPDLTPVSDADRAVEGALRDAIERKRPREGVLGEELGGGEDSAARWVLDPIDGTR